jgi:hypothetical protein
MWYTGTHNQEAIELAEAWLYGAHDEGLTWVKLNQLAELRIQGSGEGDVADFTTSSTC